MKKFLTLFLVCLLCFSLVACSSQPTYIPPSSGSSSSSEDEGGTKVKDKDKDRDEDIDEDIDEDEDEDEGKGGKTKTPGDVLDLDAIAYDKVDDEVKANKINRTIDLSVSPSDITITGYTLAKETHGDKTEYYAYIFIDYSNNLDEERCFYNGYINFYQNGVSLSNSQFEGDGFTSIKKGAKVDLIIKVTLRDLTTDIDIELENYTAGYRGTETAEATLKIK